MSLRPYQSDSIDAVQSMFASGKKRVILCAPTGSGKTIMFSDIAWKAFVKAKRVMILTHRKELLKQAGKSNNCEIVMVETLHNRIKKGFDVNQVDLMIIDEAHIGSFRKILEHYKGYLIGATATPIAKPPLCLLYDDIVCNVDIPSLISQGFLSRPKTFVKTSVDVSELKVSKGDYSEASLDNLYNKPKVYTGMVDDYIRMANGIKAIVFCVNIEHTINCYLEFKARGVEVYMIHSNMKEWERDLAIDQFTASKNGVLVNASIATTGFDVPDILLVIINRATTSLALWLQMCGRGSRIIDAILSKLIGRSEKKDFTIWDYGDNVVRLGHWEAERNWKKIFFDTGKKKKKDQAAPVKTCENCQAVVYASAKKCPHCGNEFPVNTIVLPEGKLKELVYKRLEGKWLWQLEYNDVFEVAKDKGWKQGFVERILFYKEEGPTRPEHPLQRFYDSKEYHQGYRDRKIAQYTEENRPPKNFIITR